MKSVARIISTAALFLFVVGILWAGDVTGGVSTTIDELNEFTPNTTASSTDVNQNFALLRDAVNDNDSRIDTLKSTAAIKDGTLQTNLNADLLDGQHGSYYLSASNVNAGTLNNARFSAYSDLSAEGYLGNASGDVALNNGTTQVNLSADLLDGINSSQFVRSDTTATHSGTYLQVNGQLRAYGNYLYMNSGSDYLRWDTTNGWFYLSDDLYVAGTLTVSSTISTIRLSGEVNKSGYSANLVPVAYGFVWSTGTLYATSGNVSVTRTGTGQYQITITGESFYYTDYVVAASPVDSGTLIDWGSVSDKLTVACRTTAGAYKDARFSFVVYKP